MTSRSRTVSGPSAHRYRRVGTFAVVAALGLIAACGSDSKSSSTTAAAPAATSGAATATTAAATATTSGSGATTGGSTAGSVAGGSGVAAATAATAENKKEPTTIGVTEPLKAKPDPGKTIVWLQCDVNQCKDEGDGLKAAAEAIGWNYKSLNYQSA